MKNGFRITILMVLTYALVFPHVVRAVPGVADGIPEPEQRNVIVQLFNWRFKDIEKILPQLKELGYSHVHVSPPQKSNEHVWQWWGRYQPVDFSVLKGPLGTEQEFKDLNNEANDHGIKIIVDVIFNHTIDVTQQPSPKFVEMDGKFIVREKFPQFEPQDFHEQCKIEDNAEKCWLFENLADLKTETTRVRTIAKGYLQKLVGLGADGFRFDAARHIESDFFTDVLSVVPDAYAFGEIIDPSTDAIPSIDLDFYDFPLAAQMRQAFKPGGDLKSLKDAQKNKHALPGIRAITFVRNHDIDRGQADDGGIRGDGRETFGIGWDEGNQNLNRTDVNLAYAFIFGREDGFPYVFVDMPTLPAAKQDDRFSDPNIGAGIRFHNLCLETTTNGRRADIWRIEEQDQIGWQRGTDRFVVVNKAAKWYPITNLKTSLQKGTYKDVRTGWPMDIQNDGTIAHWDVPPRTAIMLIRISD